MKAFWIIRIVSNCACHKCLGSYSHRNPRQISPCEGILENQIPTHHSSQMKRKEQILSLVNAMYFTITWKIIVWSHLISTGRKLKLVFNMIKFCINTKRKSLFPIHKYTGHILTKCTSLPDYCNPLQQCTITKKINLKIAFLKKISTQN
jgi:hypothetical protein